MTPRVESGQIDAVKALPQAVIRAAAEFLAGEHSIILVFRNRGGPINRPPPEKLTATEG